MASKYKYPPKPINAILFLSIAGSILIPLWFGLLNGSQSSLSGLAYIVFYMPIALLFWGLSMLGCTYVYLTPTERRTRNRKNRRKLVAINIISSACIALPILWGSYLVIYSVTTSVQNHAIELRDKDYQKKEFQRDTEYIAFQEKLKKNHCEDIWTVGQLDLSKRVDFYMKKIQDKYTDENYINSLDETLDNARKDCANGIISSEQQISKVDNTATEIVNDYIEYFGKESYYKYNKHYKELEKQGVYHAY